MILKILGGLLLLLLLVVGGVALYLNQIVSTAIEKGGSRALGVRTSVSGVLVRPISGNARILGLEIANPPGYDEPNFLVLDDGFVSLDTGTLRSPTIEITQILLDGIELELQKRGGKLNTDALLENMKKPGKKPPAETDDEAAGGPEVVVRELLIRNVTAHVDMVEAIGKYGRVEVEIPEIRLTDVGAKDGGADLAELTDVVVAALLRAVSKHGKNLPGELTRDLSARLGNIAQMRFQVEGDVTGTAVDASGEALAVSKSASDAAASAEEAVKGVTDATNALGGLFKSKKKE